MALPEIDHPVDRHRPEGGHPGLLLGVAEVVGGGLLQLGCLFGRWIEWRAQEGVHLEDDEVRESQRRQAIAPVEGTDVAVTLGGWIAMDHDRLMDDIVEPGFGNAMAGIK